MSWWWPFFKIEPNAERPPERLRCTEPPWHCQAWAWNACTGGRCKYHCDIYCRCVPVGAPGELTVIEGGRKA